MPDVQMAITLFCPLVTRDIKIGNGLDCRECEHFRGVDTKPEFWVVKCGLGEKKKAPKKKAK